MCYGCRAGDQAGRKRARHHQDAETAEPELESDAQRQKRIFALSNKTRLDGLESFRPKLALLIIALGGPKFR